MYIDSRWLLPSILVAFVGTLYLALRVSDSIEVGRVRDVQRNGASTAITTERGTFSVARDIPTAIGAHARIERRLVGDSFCIDAPMEDACAPLK